MHAQYRARHNNTNNDWCHLELPEQMQDEAPYTLTAAAQRNEAAQPVLLQARGAQTREGGDMASVRLQQTETAGAAGVGYLWRAEWRWMCLHVM